MKVRCIDGSWSSNELTTGKEYEVLSEVWCYYQLKINDKGIRYHCYAKSRFEVIKEDNKTEELSDDEIDFVQEIVNECSNEKMKEKNKMEKTFREVIADIKEGEVWECGHILITKSNDGIELKGMSSYSSYFTDDNKIFKLQRKEYTFEEAFKAYEDGKEIESCYSGDKYMIQHGGSDCYADGSKTGTIGFNEIRGKWYINN